MIDNKHTDGPWSIEHFNAPIADTGDYDCVTRVLGPAKETVVEFFNGNDTDEANARLIAAAPDLLAVCQGVLSHPSFKACDCGEPDCATTVLRAVIAKATGR